MGERFDAQALREAREAAQVRLQEDADENTQGSKLQQVQKLNEAERVLSERRAKREERGKEADFLAINTAELEAVIQQQKDKTSARASYKPSVSDCEIYKSSAPVHERLDELGDEWLQALTTVL